MAAAAVPPANSSPIWIDCAGCDAAGASSNLRDSRRQETARTIALAERYTSLRFDRIISSGHGEYEQRSASGGLLGQVGHGPGEAESSSGIARVELAGDD